MSHDTPPSEPPHPPGGSGAPPPPPPPGGGWGTPPYSVSTAFTYALEKFKANWGPLVLISLVLIVAGLVAFGISYSLLVSIGNPSNGSPFALFNGQWLLNLVSSMVLLPVVIVLQAGVVNGALRLSRNQTLSVGEAFSGFNWGHVLVTGLIVGVATSIGYSLCYLPGLVVGFFTAFSLYFVIDLGMAPLEAIGACFTWTRNHVGDLVLLYLATVAAYIVGTCLCGVGLLMAVPVVVLAQVYTFRTLHGDPVQA